MDLGEGAGLDAAAQDLVKLRRAGRDLDDVALALQEEVVGGLEAEPAAHLARRLLGLEDLGLGQALDPLEVARRRHHHRIGSVIAGVLELLDVACGVGRGRLARTVRGLRAELLPMWWRRFLACGRGRACRDVAPRWIPTASRDEMGVKERSSCSALSWAVEETAVSRRTVVAMVEASRGARRRVFLASISSA